MHGVGVADPYRWLEDGQSAETRAWLAEQQEYALPFLNTPERERFHRRLSDLVKIDAVGFPIYRNGDYFFSRRRAEEKRAAICRRHGVSAEDHVLIAPDSISADEMVGVHIAGLSRDGSMLLYGVRRGGEDEFEIRLMDLKTPRDQPDLLPRARYSLASW